MEGEFRILPKILAHIFKFLDARAKVNASSVCKRWMEVFNVYPDLLEDISINFRQSRLQLFSILTRKFSRFHFAFMTIDHEFFLLLERFGSQFRSLTFYDCKIQGKMDRKLQNCKQLLELKVLYGDALGIFPHLPALKSLKITFNDDVCERDLEHLEQITPLSLTNLSIRNSVDDIFFGLDVEDFIYMRRFSIQSLEFNGPMILDFNRLSKMEGLRLKRFKLDAYKLLNNTIEYFCNHQPGIVALELGSRVFNNRGRRRCSAVKYVNVEEICNALPQLEELSITACTTVNESLATIFQLKHLRRLELIQCRGIETESFLEALEGFACCNLEILNLFRTFINRSTLSKLFALVPNLREIYLSEIIDFQTLVGSSVSFSNVLDV